MTPIEISCNHQNADLTNCGADAHEPCRLTEWDRARAQPEFHAERIAEAAGIDTGQRVEPTVAQFDAAVASFLF
jgi:hypothetical protein